MQKSKRAPTREMERELQFSDKSKVMLDALEPRVLLLSTRKLPIPTNSRNPLLDRRENDMKRKNSYVVKREGSGPPDAGGGRGH